MQNSYIVEDENGSAIVVNSYVNPSSLTLSEAAIWSLKDIVLKSIGGMPDNIDAIRIAEVIQYENRQAFTEGICRWSEREIVISRGTLNRKEEFLGVLLHELAHATSKAGDGTKSFEDELTNMLGYIATSLCHACNFDSNNIVPAKSLDNRYFAYASCKCPTCGSTNFDTNDDKTYAKCMGCGREFRNGYAELVDLNRKMIEEQGISAVLNKLVGSMWVTNLNDDIFVLEFNDNEIARMCIATQPPMTMVEDFHYGKYELTNDNLTFAFDDEIMGLHILEGEIGEEYLYLSGTHRNGDGKLTPIKFPTQRMQ